MEKAALKSLVKNLGERYSKMLRINLASKDDKEIFKWFLASILFGAPITETAAMKTYECFRKHDVLTPKRILDTGWDGLVKILDEGGYTRYDFKTADKLLEVMQNFMEKYDGSLSKIHEEASDISDLENRLKSLGKGIGDVTVVIFLRELRSFWRKAAPTPTSLVITAARNIGIIEDITAENALERLKDFWAENKDDVMSFVNFETALLRIGKDFCRKRKCASCPVKNCCVNPTVL
jgi:endonuclease III